MPLGGHILHSPTDSQHSSDTSASDHKESGTGRMSRRSLYEKDGESMIAKAKAFMRRSLSSSSDKGGGGGGSMDRDREIPEGGTLGRRPRALTRSSLHQTGTQSAYSSRDASPEGARFRFRRLSPFPAPPPSILINPTPPRTPRRSPIPGSGLTLMTTGVMTRLYQKLAAIEREETGSQGEIDGKQSEMAETTAIVQERAGAVRILTKSLSIDSSEHEPQYVPSDTAPSSQDLEDLPELLAVYNRYADIYEDAPISQTLPASIRIGEIVITPGIEALTRAMTPEIKRAALGRTASRQNSLKRKQFFENYEAQVLIKQEKEPAKEKPSKDDTNKKEEEEKEEPKPVEQHKETEPQKTASKPFFFQTVKERRKLFRYR